MAATLTTEDVRLQLIAQIEAILTGWKHARHVFSGVESQGAQIGDRSFDIRVGRSVPASSGRGGAERVRTGYVIRLRHVTPPKEGTKIHAKRAEDTRTVEVRIRDLGAHVAPDAEVRWISTAPPVPAANGAFTDTDIEIQVDYWSAITGGSNGRS
jgi:hypothetical protein